jgi:hypothetical protein
MDGDINMALDALAFSKFVIGQPVPRNEDPTLRGQGRHTDDLNLPAWLTRSLLAAATHMV